MLETGNDNIVSDDDQIPAAPAVEIDTTPLVLLDAVQQRRASILFNNQPIDKDERELMKDIAQTAVQQQRIAVDTKTADTSAELAKTLGQMVIGGVNTRRKEPIEGSVEEVLPTTTNDIIDNYVPSAELVTTSQEEISLEDIMKAK